MRSDNIKLLNGTIIKNSIERSLTLCLSGTHPKTLNLTYLNSDASRTRLFMRSETYLNYCIHLMLLI
jgi:hypothetical protein